jgi:hypothetical protein
MQNEVSQITSQVQARMRTELQFQEEFIPNDKDEARSSIFVSSDLHENPRMCVFMQCGPGVVPGLWGLPQNPSSVNGPAFIQALSQFSMLPYFKAAVQSGQSVMVMNPSTNAVTVRGVTKKVLHSGTPEDHVQFVWNTFILPFRAIQQINFIVADGAGHLLNHFLRQLPPEQHVRMEC